MATNNPHIVNTYNRTITKKILVIYLAIKLSAELNNKINISRKVTFNFTNVNIQF